MSGFSGLAMIIYRLDGAADRCDDDPVEYTGDDFSVSGCWERAFSSDRSGVW